jgi:hypothetical protein
MLSTVFFRALNAKNESSSVRIAKYEIPVNGAAAANMIPTRASVLSMRSPICLHLFPLFSLQKHMP